MLERRRMTTSTPNTPDRNARRRAVLALARDLLIRARVIELRWLAEQTARGELPVPDDDAPQNGDGK